MPLPPIRDDWSRILHTRIANVGIFLLFSKLIYNKSPAFGVQEGRSLVTQAGKLSVTIECSLPLAKSVVSNLL